MDAPVDYYKVLGVDRNADSNTIQDAFRKKARLTHPDLRGGVSTDDEFKRINEAYQTLRNEDKRRAYDRLQAHMNVRSRGEYKSVDPDIDVTANRILDDFYDQMRSVSKETYSQLPAIIGRIKQSLVQLQANTELYAKIENEIRPILEVGPLVQTLVEYRTKGGDAQTFPYQSWRMLDMAKGRTKSMFDPFVRSFESDSYNYLHPVRIAPENRVVQPSDSVDTIPISENNIVQEQWQGIKDTGSLNSIYLDIDNVNRMVAKHEVNETDAAQMKEWIRDKVFRLLDQDIDGSSSLIYIALEPQTLEAYRTAGKITEAQSHILLEKIQRRVHTILLSHIREASSTLSNALDPKEIELFTTKGKLSKEQAESLRAAIQERIYVLFRREIEETTSSFVLDRIRSEVESSLRDKKLTDDQKRALDDILSKK